MKTLNEIFVTIVLGGIASFIVIGVIITVYQIVDSLRNR